MKSEQEVAEAQAQNSADSAPAGSQAAAAVAAQQAQNAATGQDGASSDETPASPEDALRNERDKLKDQLLRTAADFENFRRRSRRDVEDAARRAKEEAIVTMLPIIDNLERAVQAAETAQDAATVAEGVQMVLRQFEDVAEQLGLGRVAGVGERFDPMLHDAVQQLESADHEPGTIMAEVMPGYRLGEKLVRAAMVVVAKAPTSAPNDGE